MDSSTPSSRAALYQDSLTGLLTVQGWVKELLGSVFPADGSLIAFEVAGVNSVNQAFGHSAGDLLLCEVVTRARQALPPTAILMRGREHTVFAFLPDLSGMVVEAFVSHLRQGVCSAPFTLPGGEQIYPKLVTAVLSVVGNTPVIDAAVALERTLVRQPDLAGETSGVQRAVSAQDELNHRLEAVRLFGRDELIEHILAELKLPGLQPETVLLVAPPLAGKTRLLGNILSLLDGQHLPLAEVICRPSDQHVPFTLIVSIIDRFLTAYRTELLQQRLGTLCVTSPWLTGLFPVLRGFGEPPPPPREESQLRHGLEAVLIELVRYIPHVAVIHSINQADPESLAALIALQSMPGHGLRIIAGADAEDDGMPTVLRRYIRQKGTVISLPSLSEAQVLDYLREVVPTVAQPAIAARLFRETSGLLLAVEATLRAWVEDGLLTLNGNRWEFFPEKVPAAQGIGLSVPDREMLAQAALAGPRTVAFLASLWQVAEEQARVIIDRGRALGYLNPPDLHDPELVQFHDPDEAATFAQQLNSEARIAVHATIAALMEAQSTARSDGYLRELAYHYDQSGQAARAETYYQVVQPIIMAAPAPAATMRADMERWDISAPTPVTTDDMPLLLDAIQCIRMAGVKLRLYPANSPIVQRAVRESVESLERLLSSRPSLVIAYDGRNVAVDGQVFTRRDLQITMKDYLTWLSEAQLRAIGFAPGVGENELCEFLKALVLFELTDENTSLADNLLHLPLVNIKVLSRDLQADPTATMYQPNASGSMMPQGFIGAGTALPPGFTGTGTLPATSTGSNLPFDLNTLMNNIPGGTPPSHGHAPAGGTQADAPGEVQIDPSALLANPMTVDPAMWGRLPGMLDRIPAPARRLTMANLTRWLREQENQEPGARACPIGLDHLLIERINTETDLIALRETALTSEKRLEQLMQAGAWDEMIALLEPIRARLAKDRSTDVQRQLGGVLDRIGEGATLRGLIDQSIQHPGSLDRVRRVVILLGERALRPLINTLKNATAMQERVRLMQLLREFGDTQQPLLLAELRTPNAWYVYRNLLQVLEEIGTTDALGTIAEKLRHDDTRVRAEAVTAAVRIGKEQATTYLLTGLQDEDPDVRARALSLVGFCATPRVQEQVLRLLMPPRIGKDEPESVQLAAVLALGQFDDVNAFGALLEIIHPRLFSPFRRKSEEVRSAAVSALVNHLDRPGAPEAVQQATRDRSLAIRQTAQRIWQQYLREGGNPAI